MGDVVVVVEMLDTLATSRAWRIRSRSTALRTADGFGPGTRVREMVTNWQGADFLYGEGSLVVKFENHPGLSFEISWPGRWNWEDVSELERTGNASLVPESSVVTLVLLFGRRQ